MVIFEFTVENEKALSPIEQALETSKKENTQLREDISTLKVDLEKARKDNDSLRNECQDAWKVSAERRDEISSLKQALESEKANATRANMTAESLKKQNYELLSKNSALNEKNLKLRDECNVFRAREEEMRALVNIQANILGFGGGQIVCVHMCIKEDYVPQDLDLLFDTFSFFSQYQLKKKTPIKIFGWKRFSFSIIVDDRTFLLCSKVCLSTWKKYFW